MPATAMVLKTGRLLVSWRSENSSCNVTVVTVRDEDSDVEWSISPLHGVKALTATVPAEVVGHRFFATVIHCVKCQTSNVDGYKVIEVDTCCTVTSAFDGDSDLLDIIKSLNIKTAGMGQRIKTFAEFHFNM